MYFVFGPILTLACFRYIFKIHILSKSERDIILRQNVWALFLLIILSFIFFSVDCSSVLLSDVTAYVLFDGESMEHHVTSHNDNPNLYTITFEAKQTGLYTVAVFCGGVEVRGRDNE